MALVVDDNATNRRILFQMLSIWDLVPVLASSGAEALQALACVDRPFDLIVTDGDMPFMDGCELARRIRSLPSYVHVPILLLSSGGTPGDPSRCLEAGIQRILVKPVDPSALLLAIQTLLRTHPKPPPPVADLWRLDTALSDSRPPSVQPVPARHESGDEPGDHSSHAAVPGPPGGASILLAEDNEVNQKIAVIVLERAGYRVTVVANGLEALDQLSEQPFDLCLMDVYMPELDGLAATREIRRREAGRTRLPIIAMTANALTGDRDICLAAGMDDYVSKPVTADHLRVTVERWLAPAIGN
jgi:two-component system, sensor histidine kinase and response regulator